MTYVESVGRNAYVWGWALVSSHNRRVRWILLGWTAPNGIIESARMRSLRDLIQRSRP